MSRPITPVPDLTRIARAAKEYADLQRNADAAAVRLFDECQLARQYGMKPFRLAKESGTATGHMNDIFCRRKPMSIRVAERIIAAYRRQQESRRAGSSQSPAPSHV